MVEMRKSYEMAMQARATCESCEWTVGPGPKTVERAMHHGTSRKHAVRVIVEHLEFWEPVDE